MTKIKQHVIDANKSIIINKTNMRRLDSFVQMIHVRPDKSKLTLLKISDTEYQVSIDDESVLIDSSIINVVDKFNSLVTAVNKKIENKLQNQLFTDSIKIHIANDSIFHINKVNLQNIDKHKLITHLRPDGSEILLFKSLMNDNYKVMDNGREVIKSGSITKVVNHFNSLITKSNTDSEKSKRIWIQFN